MVIPSEEVMLEALSQGKEIFSAHYDGLTIGGADASFANESSETSLNDPARAALAGVQAGAALAKSGGLWSGLGDFLRGIAVKAKAKREFEFWTTDPDSMVEAIATAVGLQSSAVRSSVKIENLTSNSVEVAKMFASKMVELEELRQVAKWQTDHIETLGRENRQLEAKLEPEAVEPVASSQGAPVEGGAPYPVSGTIDGFPFDQNLLVKPSGDSGGTVILLPASLNNRYRSATILGKKPYQTNVNWDRDKNTSTNGSEGKPNFNGGRRHIRFNKLPGGTTVLELRLADPPEVLRVTVDPGKRTNKPLKDYSVKREGPAATPDVGALPSKHGMLFAGTQVLVSDYLADLERRSNDWLAGKGANDGQGPVSNIIVENTGQVRHVFIRTASKNLYELPNTIKAGHRGDLKIRLPNKSHTYLKGIEIPTQGTIDLAASSFLADVPPYGRVAAISGWQ